jgi:hypothetical protein
MILLKRKHCLEEEAEITEIPASGQPASVCSPIHSPCPQRPPVRNRGFSRGTVTLVALCFVAVMGITLAGYIAVCSRAMNLSNRTFQAGLSKQLAEVGVDEALRAFNKNDWADWSNSGTAADWTVSATTATCNLTFPSGKFGQGVTGSVKIRIDNYNANQLDATWSSAKAYRVNNLVGYNGLWYRCTQNHTSSASITPLTSTSYPNLAYWVPAPISWRWNSNKPYTQDWDVVNYAGTWYRCILTHTSSTSILPTNTTYWASMPAPVLAIYTNTPYSAGTFAYRVSNGTWYRCLVTHTVGSSLDESKWSAVTAPYISWSYQSGTTYSFNDVIYFGAAWYRCKVASTTSSPTVAPADWENALTGSMHAWVSGYKYNLGDAVYYTAQAKWYRCILAHTSSGTITPTNTTYWATAPLLSNDWDSTKQYSLDDTVRYNGVWYISIHNGTLNIAQNPATATSYWIGANTSTTSYQWNATTAYAIGAYKCYGGVWYKCIAATTAGANHTPNNTSYWNAAWAQGSGVTTGAPVVYAEGTIAITGSPSIKTQLRTVIASAPLFPNAVAATTSIRATSGGTVDSYNADIGTTALQNGVAGATAGTSDAIYGTYASHAGTSTNYSAVVAAGDTTGTAINLSSTAVRGYASAASSSTSPYAPLFSSGGSVKGPSSPASPNIDLTRVSRSPHIPQFDTLPVNSSGAGGGLAANWATISKGTPLPLSYTTNIGTPGATTPSLYYYNGNLTVGTGTLNVLRINGPVILYINGDLFITASGSTGRIDIANTGSAEIHVAGVFKADAIGEGIQNYTADPKKLIIICDTTSTSTHFYSEGVNDLYGVIYIPYSMSSTGYFNDNTNTEIFGAISASKINYSGANLNVHYDTSLRYATFGGVDQPYTVSEWRELPQTERATMP